MPPSIVPRTVPCSVFTIESIGSPFFDFGESVGMAAAGVPGDPCALRGY